MIDISSEGETLEACAEVLQAVFGYEAFRGPQAGIVTHVSDGGDALVLMPTGGGKSLCFQLPALCRDGVTVVISPLIALMRDQVRALKAAGVEAGALTSGNTEEETEEVFTALDEGRLKLLYLAPERLAAPATVPMLRRIGFGRLPGDLRFRWRGREWDLPLASTLLLSFVASLIAKWI